jgi:signal recognition particle GTPase
LSMNTKLEKLTLEELKAFIDDTVDKRLEERFGDPDVGLDVKPEIIKIIRNSRRRKIVNPAEEVAERPGLKW